MIYRAYVPLWHVFTSGLDQPLAQHQVSLLPFKTHPSQKLSIKVNIVNKVAGSIPGSDKDKKKGKS